MTQLGHSPAIESDQKTLLRNQNIGQDYGLAPLFSSSQRLFMSGIADIPCPNYLGRERANKGPSNWRKHRLTGGEIEGLLADRQK